MAYIEMQGKWNERLDECQLNRWAMEDLGAVKSV